MTETRAGRPPALEIKSLNVYYGASHALQGVDLKLSKGVLSVVGRNGMGKSTLCKAIMGIVPVASGTISFGGKVLAGKTPAEIARLGIGYVPQGRRLWRSLTVDEHLQLVARDNGSWSIERIYDSFPRLAERKSNGGAQLSGGEQQMLAIGRALLLNPKLLVMDEPTEGLAPVIVSHVEDMLLKLADEGEIDVLVIEQNIGVATNVAENVAVMVNGRVSRMAVASELASDRELQQRLLGVGQHSHDGDIENEQTSETAMVNTDMVAQPYTNDGYTLGRITRWSNLAPADKAPPNTGLTNETRLGEVLLLADMDRYADEIPELSKILRKSGHNVTTIDISTARGHVSSADIPSHQLAAWHPSGAAGIFDGRKSDARLGISEALGRLLAQSVNVKGIMAVLDFGDLITIAPVIVDRFVDIPVVVVSEGCALDLGNKHLAGNLVLMSAHGREARFRTSRAAVAALDNLMNADGPRSSKAQTGAPVGLIVGLASNDLARSVRTHLHRNYPCNEMASNRGGMLATSEMLRQGQISAIVDLDQSDVSSRIYGGASDAVSNRTELLCRQGSPYFAILSGGEALYQRATDAEEPRLSRSPVISIRKLNRSEAETVGRAIAADFEAVKSDVTFIIPKAASDSAQYWLSEAFVAAFRQGEGRRILRSDSGPSKAETLRLLDKALGESNLSAGSQKRIVSGVKWNRTNAA